MAMCWKCNGSGKISSSDGTYMTTCYECGGSGTIQDSSSSSSSPSSSSSSSSGGGGGSSLDPRLTKGHTYYENGQYDQAISLFNEIIASERNLSIDQQMNAGHAFHYRSMCYLGKRDYQQAVSDSNEASNRTSIAGNLAALYYVRAEAFEGLGNIKQAIKDYRYAVNYGNSNYTNLAADALRRLGVKNWTYKNHAVLCVLSTLLGWAGIDRFYAGRKFLGVLKIVAFVAAWPILGNVFGISQKTASGALLIVAGLFGWWIIDSIQALLGLQRAKLNHYRIRSDSKTASIVVTVIFAAVMSFFTFLVIAGLTEQADKNAGVYFEPTSKKQKEYAAQYPAGLLLSLIIMLSLALRMIIMADCFQNLLVNHLQSGG